MDYLVLRVLLPWEINFDDLPYARVVAVPKPAPNGFDRPISVGDRVVQRRIMYEKLLSGSSKIVVILDNLVYYGFSPPSPPLYYVDGVVVWGDWSRRIRVEVWSDEPVLEPWVIRSVHYGCYSGVELGLLTGMFVDVYKRYLDKHEGDEYLFPGSPFMRGFLGVQRVDVPAGFVFPGRLGVYLSDVAVIPRISPVRTLDELVVYANMFKYPGVMVAGDEEE